ncbi:MAG: DUF475 domain-containing protein [Isosphaeraceae bacterium]
MILLTILLLAVMEVSLSFDNAVVNALVLKGMSPVWQRRFLTWGILIAVFGMRLVLPVVIVSAAGGGNVADVAVLALTDAAEYGRRLTAAHTAIASFGGMFLLMVFLHFICDEAKDVHWLGWFERRLAGLGRMEAVEIGLAIAVLLVAPGASVFAGLLGLLCYIAVKGAMGLCGEGDDPAACVSGKQGLVGFLYLEILDASFSLDGVIGAFAMTNDIVAIMIGLGIGALVIRSMTVRMVRIGTLAEFIYLEHGAHWGIGALAVLMLGSTSWHVPEVVTGLVGAGCILASLASSVRHNRRLASA